MSSIPLPHLHWLKNKVKGEEHVTFESFVIQFDLTDQESATHAYRQLINFPEIRKSRRQHLQEAFDFFRKNGEKTFWAKRAVAVSSEVVANHALVSVQEFGQLQSQVVLASAARDSLVNSRMKERDDFKENRPSVSQVPVDPCASDSYKVATAASDGSDGTSGSPFVSALSPMALKRPRTPIGKATKKVARYEVSKSIIKEPWHSLIETALLQYDGFSVELPETPVDIEQEGARRSILYHTALCHLRDASVRQLHAHYDRAKCLDYKDAFVALSGIWNTFSSFTNDLFGKDLTEEAKALCYLPPIDNKDDKLGEIVKSLLQKQTLTEMLDETYKLQVAHPTYRRILDVLQILIRNIIRPLHGSKEPSEADCVAVWSSLFQEGLSLDCRLSMHLGEQGCSASALSKSKLADIFETGIMPRKCDCLLTIDSLEVGNFECKRAGASKQEVACQLRKNIKINKSILLELEKYGLECPPLLSIHGMSAIVFRIRKWHDIWVAGKASRTIVLPSTFDELVFFLGDPVHRLSNLLDYYHLYATQAHRTYQHYKYNKKGEDEEDAVSSYFAKSTETLEWEHVVLHTPTKAARRPSLLEKLRRVEEDN